MAKKNFTGGLNSLLGDTQPEKTKAPPEPRGKDITKTTQEGTYKGEIRATFIVNEGKLETLKALAYWERKKIKELLDEAITLYINNKDKEFLNKAILEYKK